MRSTSGSPAATTSCSSPITSRRPTRKSSQCAARRALLAARRAVAAHDRCRCALDVEGHSRVRGVRRPVARPSRPVSPCGRVHRCCWIRSRRALPRKRSSWRVTA
eukprot:5443990-Prymnesium_polylepis.1